MRSPLVTTLFALASLTPVILLAQGGAPGAAGGPPAPGPMRPPPIVLGPDDVRAVADAPAGFNAKRDGIPHGRLEMIEYDSKTVGTRRKMLVYTPPGYSTTTKYPVLYLLHGIGGDETEWQRFTQPENIADNLIANGTAVPMILVFPNGRAEMNDRAEGNVFAHGKAFENFEGDLLNDVILQKYGQPQRTPHCALQQNEHYESRLG